jgi:hypothetical protein
VDSGEDVYVGTKCRADFGDIRFTKSDGVTLLDYWLESYDGGVAIFWVEVDSIPASPDRVTIYIYYGKSDATTTSNGDDTFLFFDHFDGASLDLTKWMVEKDSTYVTYTIVNSVLRATGSGSAVGSPAEEIYKALFSMSASGYAIIARLRIATPAAGAKMFARAGFYNSYTPTYRFSHAGQLGNNWDGYNAMGIYMPGWAYVGGTILDDTDLNGNFVNYELRLLNQTTGQIQILMNGVDKGTFTNSNIAGYTLNPAFSVAPDTATNAQFELDYLFVRKYVSPEPSHGSWGSEQTLVIIERFQEEGMDFRDPKFTQFG